MNVLNGVAVQTARYPSIQPLLAVELGMSVVMAARKSRIVRVRRTARSTLCTLKILKTVEMEQKYEMSIGVESCACHRIPREIQWILPQPSQFIHMRVQRKYAAT